MPRLVLPITLLRCREHAIQCRAGANAPGCTCLLKAPPDFPTATPRLPECEYKCECGICGNSFHYNFGVPAVPPCSILLHTGRGPHVPLQHSGQSCSVFFHAADGQLTATFPPALPLLCGP